MLRKFFFFFIAVMMGIPSAFALEIVEYRESDVKKEKESESVYALHFFAESCY